MLTILVVLCGALAAADDLLLRVRLAPDQSPAQVACAGADVLFLLDDGCIARADADALPALAASFSVEQLDREPAEKCYVYASDDHGLDKDALAVCGDVLTMDAGGVLLRTTEDGIESLNRLPVELARVPMRPMVFVQPGVPEPCAVDDSLVRMLVGRVSPDSIEAHLRRLIGFYTRYSTTDSCRRAVDWMREQLTGYNCDSTALHTFRSNYAPNVIGVKRGTVNPQRIYVVCGHVDNTSELAPPGFAPGSDDNASGTGTVLEVARVCADIAFENTVWFIGFSGEEQGLVGSDSFANACRRRGDSIALAINFDMVSYGRDDSVTVVYTSTMPQTRTMALYFLALADTFTELAAKDTLLNTASSDHASFWRYGYLAIRGRYHDRTPKYHTTGDTIGPFHYVNCGTNNLPMYTEVVKATVAFLARLAGAHRPVGSEERATPRPAVPARSGVFSRTAGIRLPGGSCRIFGASGSMVRTVRTSVPSWTWHGTDQAGRPLGSGLYFVRVCADGQTASLKLALSD